MIDVTGVNMRSGLIEVIPIDVAGESRGVCTRCPLSSSLSFVSGETIIRRLLFLIYIGDVVVFSSGVSVYSCDECVPSLCFRRIRFDDDTNILLLIYFHL